MAIDDHDSPAPDAPAEDTGPETARGRVRRAELGTSDAAAGIEAAIWAGHVAAVAEAGDHAAFAALFAHFAPRVKAFLMRGGANEAQAEECAQDVMVTVWRKAELFDPARATVATWIFTIARNRRIDVVRKENRPEPEPEDLSWGPEAEPGPAEQVATRQESALLRAAMSRLPKAQKDLIERAYFGDLSHSEISRATGLPLGTIKSRIRLALERLRREMKMGD